MKKLFIASTIVGSLLSSLANAKTEGNYVGIDLIRTEVEAYSYSTHNERHSGEENSFGVNYKYAFNFNNFFVAPGIFYNHNNTEAKSSTFSGSALNYELNLKYSYGVKVDFGYDFTDKFAAFGVVGHSENRINELDTSAGVTTSEQDITREAFLYGVGVKYSIADNVDVSAGYEVSQYGKSSDIFNTTDSFNSSYRLAKIGASYKF